MLKRRKPQRMTDRPETSFPAHRKWVRGHVCIVPGCDRSDIECCHVRKGLPADTPNWARGGTARKPMDAFTFPACSCHHAQQHSIGEDTFASLHNIKPLAEALALAASSPVQEVREFRRLLK